jgi:hypothetical protein
MMAERPEDERYGEVEPSPFEWVRHILLDPAGKVLELAPEQTFGIGRDASNDLAIPSKRCSRQHARIVWVDGDPWLEDLGSHNGSFLDGKRIEGLRRLRSGQRIAIGPVQISYHAVEGVGSMQTIEGLRSCDPHRKTSLSESVAHDDVLVGNLGDLSLIELSQNLEMHEKTGTLNVYAPTGRGWIAVSGGRPMEARCGEERGLPALLALLRLAEGSFTFTRQLEPGRRTIHERFDQIILRELAARDEAGRAAGEA